ncbi:hypothetical protein IHE49_00950 [Rhodanobacter sp. 7MK24]|uniref:hypothetical protein n=1 Tax=Rhodanobacter sp. 7MK24 TaxID=2775922 RepID=UPI0017865C9D|nr:hypothetical protein [Rhodanobacter sp. 7MK24]MBD8879042.1 hypothetical protein [Rhodanobacter sp. 7MK24]
MKTMDIAFLGCCVLASFAALAQTDLPAVKVTAPPFSSQHGGYLVSGDFKVDPRMPSVVFPAQALVKGDILSIEPVSLQDDEYLVLQECASADCREASVVRFWTADNIGGGDARYNRVRITHENKYFIWLKRLPDVSGQSCGQGWLKFSSDTTQCGSHFTSFQQISPPLVLIPSGGLAAFHQEVLQKAIRSDPVRVARQSHEGATYVVTYEGGSIARIQRMHATHGSQQDRQ